MPLQNRVTPFGEIVAVEGRGLLLGNRGILHDDERRIVRSWQVQRWITCVTAFRGRHRELMRPHSYTELFFLDEAAAFAAGHRPCAECRYSDYQRFKAAWATAHGQRMSAEQMDAVIHADRLEGRGRAQRKRTYSAEIASLPDGAYIAHEGRAWLLWRGKLLAWSAGAYTERRPAPRAGMVEVLTPAALVAVFRAGYTPGAHPSAEAVTGG